MSMLIFTTNKLGNEFVIGKRINTVAGLYKCMKKAQQISRERNALVCLHGSIETPNGEFEVSGEGSAQGIIEAMDERGLLHTCKNGALAVAQMYHSPARN